MKTIYPLLLLCCLIVGCKQAKQRQLKNDVKDEVSVISLDTVTKEETVLDLDSTIAVSDTIPSDDNLEGIVNDSIVNVLIEKLYLLKNDKNFNITTAFQPNKYDETLTDTLRSYIYKNDTIKMHSNIIYSAVINTTQPEILEGLKVGITKNDLEQVLAVSLDEDSIIITNLEHTNTFIFELKNNHLFKIYYDGYLD
ncbi:hypothetical protein ACG2LH_15540 [Zhouia sp. PK063]|uniref:hypothetical protein n=1 Tax=Zhouia sp. PK063 TaxID=3373602 RepID=UPI00379F88CB